MSSMLLIAHDQSAGHMQVGRGTITPGLQTHTKHIYLQLTTELYFVMDIYAVVDHLIGISTTQCIATTIIRSTAPRHSLHWQ